MRIFGEREKGKIECGMSNAEELKMRNAVPIAIGSRMRNLEVFIVLNREGNAAVPFRVYELADCTDHERKLCLFLSA